MQKMRFFRRCLPLFLAFWLLLAVAGAPFAAYAGESVTVRDSSGQVCYAAPMDPENACPALQSALDTVRSGAGHGAQRRLRHLHGYRDSRGISNDKERCAGV